MNFIVIRKFKQFLLLSYICVLGFTTNLFAQIQPDTGTLDNQFQNDTQLFVLSLVDARKNQFIREIQPDELIDLNEIGEDLLSIHIEMNNDQYESIAIDLDGPVSIKRTESHIPYTLFGDDGRTDFNGQLFKNGEYTLTITPYTEDFIKGTAGEPFTFPFSVVGELPAKVNKLILVNADTNQDIMEIEPGAVIDLDQISTNNFSFRAETETENVGSILMEISSTEINQSRVENIAPYTLFGDKDGVEYYGKDFLLGEYTITLTPYLGANQTGKPRLPQEFKFSVVEDLITSIILVDPSTGEDIVYLSKEERITTGCGGYYSLRVEADERVESVRFIVNRTFSFYASPDQLGEVLNRIENYAPYTLAGETNSGDYIPFITREGVNEIKIIPYLKNGGNGGQGKEKKVFFYGDGFPNVHSIQIINPDSRTSIGTLGFISQFIAPESGFTFRVFTGNCSERVLFDLKRIEEDQNGEPVEVSELLRTEYSAPYTLRGENPDGSFIPFQAKPGKYKLSVKIFLSDDPDDEIFSNQVEYEFEILDNPTDNQSLTMSGIDDDLIIYPNPVAQDKITLSLNNSWNGSAKVTILDKQGNVYHVQEMKKNNIKISVNNLEEGFYIVRVETNEGVYHKALIKN